jgi:GNAT superfamily N-acetyltransferase
MTARYSRPASGDHVQVDGSWVQIRRARGEDAAAVAVLASELAQSFAFARERFDQTYPALVASEDACLLVAAQGDDCDGYLLGFGHLTFYANGPVAWAEELFVRQECRGRGLGRALMGAFESWAAGRDCVLVALATRRAAPFYEALGYAESAAYLRKVLPPRDPA